MQDPYKPKTNAGHGGETHQQAGANSPTLTTDVGTPIADNQNSLTAGKRGPTLLEDFILRDKLARFDRERIPERLVHARGYSAHGYFEATEDLTAYTRAVPFNSKGKKTPVFMRISTVAGSKGSPDLARDVRGFSVKFYTEEGNWDIVGNNIPVFFIQDAIKFPDLVHAVKPEPDTEIPQAQSAHDNFWDFVSLTPESTHMLIWIMSDRTIPRSLRFIEGFGVHTFRLVNAKGEAQFVKFHFKPKLGLQSVLWNEAVKINGADPDFHRRDIIETLQKGEVIEWEMGMQIFTEEQAANFDFDVLDPTKIVPEELVPVKIVGRLVLDKLMDNAFAETEVVAFSPQNIIPGIDFSEDPLLQGRTFSYFDTQQHRLGSANFNNLPINAPRCPIHNFAQDGFIPLRQPQGRVNYEPNSWGGPRENPETGFQSASSTTEGTKIRIRPESFADHYSQARLFFTSQTPTEQTHIVHALVFELSKVKRADIRERVVSHLINVDKGLAQKVADGLGLEKLPAAAKAAVTPHDMPESSALSIIKNGPNSFKGRKLGMFVTEGSDASLVKGLKDAAEAAGAACAIIAPKISGVKLSDGKLHPVDEKIGGGPSVVFDAVAVIPSKAGADLLKADGSSKDFVADAFAHCKFIAYNDDAMPLFKAVSIDGDLDEGCIKLTKADDAKAFIQACGKLRFWEREPKANKS
ncbi:catalase [uncultured Thiothrix sp.]|uniref:catalase n=1 Tax=uncultured Thiothrix sp. TaxID=223185 RepID=UPI002636BADE|nr:catalase [uncultured Thiothrix sp.]